MSIGKLNYTGGIQSLLADINKTGIKLLRVEESHYIAYTSLPLHHRDPFDRLIIAQGQVEGIPIITKDEEFKKYGVKVIW